MSENPNDQMVFDLSTALDDMFAFEQELDDLVSLAIPKAADAMAEAFETAGDRIEAALSRAARTGEISFETMITSILSDLARLGAGSILDQVFAKAGGAISQTPPVSVQLSLPQGGDPASILSAQGQIAAAIGQAVISGGRWS